MVVQHNLQAMNSNRMLNVNAQAQAKSTEKLSSGYQINRAADDAAGLAISEKMRRQIKGLTQASANAQDGISMVQTAEGALGEVHDMLQRINQLSVKGENGTLTSADRGYIASEVQQLLSEIDRVQSTTTFNELSLLDGSVTKTGLQVGAEATQHIDITIASMGVFGKDSNKTASTADGGGIYSNDEDSSLADAVDKFYQYDTDGKSKIGASDAEKTISASDFASLNKATKIALNRVSKQRSDLGAVQNRLEHTIKNLDNVVENTTSAESSIRDTDMATEMVRYSNNNILQQAGQAMLAQANQANQGVLSLLG
ncbi:MAG: flagellin [Lachnospiraceae bacterium]|nr:flagellin [Lachnospiraceae bacterium]